jgi:hippurate hydrolase
MPDLQAIVARAVAIRRELHRHPELMHAEHRTAATVRGELDRLGIPWTACAGTGTLARLAAGRPGRHLAFRADLDALPLTEETGLAHASTVPGCMHACGHDGHTASLLATAAWFKAREADLPGPVTLLFQPAEEGGHGARLMIDGGALAGIDAIFGYHNWPGLPAGTAACPAGPVMAANGEWNATITGRGGHAAAPHDCIDPILAGAHFVSMAQQLVSRVAKPQEAAVVSVTCFHAGTADNIIPERAELVGTVRAGSTARRDELARRLEGILAAACAPSGAVPAFHYAPTYPATVNHPAEAARAQAAIGRVLGSDRLVHDGLPLMGAEDFSYYLERIPGAYLLLGSGEGDHPPACHSPRFDFDDRLIGTALRIWADLAGIPCDPKSEVGSRKSERPPS